MPIRHLKLSLQLLGLYMLTSACGAVSEISGDGNSSSTIVTNSEVLSTSLTLKDEDLTFGDSESESSSLQRAITEAKVKSAVRLKLVAEVDSPSLDGFDLRATDIFIRGNSAYVSYNVENDTQKGGIDLIDLSKPASPKLAGRILFSDRDVNAVYESGSYLYFTGADSDGAYAAQMKMKGNSFTNQTVVRRLPSFAGNDISADSNYIFITSGDRGGALSVFDKNSFDLISQIDATDARAVSAENNQKEVRVLLGSNGGDASIQEFQPKKAFSFEEFSSLDGLETAESKAQIWASKDYVMATESEAGFSVFCAADSSVLIEESTPSIESISAENRTANALQMWDSLLFTAYGEAGVYVYTLEKSNSQGDSDCKSIELSNFGRINFSDSASSNHLAYRKDYLIVATGNGIKIVQVNRNGLFVAVEANLITGFNLLPDGSSEDD